MRKCTKAYVLIFKKIQLESKTSCKFNKSMQHSVYCIVTGIIKPMRNLGNNLTIYIKSL